MMLLAYMILTTAQIAYIYYRLTETEREQTAIRMAMHIPNKETRGTFSEPPVTMGEFDELLTEGKAKPKPDTSWITKEMYIDASRAGMSLAELEALCEDFRPFRSEGHYNG